MFVLWAVGGWRNLAHLLIIINLNAELGYAPISIPEKHLRAL